MPTIKTSEVVWREDLYPRFEPDPSRIQQYAEVIELLPPIEINQHNELIDGYHRWVAHRKNELETIEATVTHTKNDIELDRLMAKRNADFGIQLTNREKRRKARQWFTDLTADEQQIADDLAVTVRTVRRWLSRKNKDMKAERDRQIAEMWLACYTEEVIAEAVGVHQSTVNRQVEELCKSDIWQDCIVFSEYRDPTWKVGNFTTCPTSASNCGISTVWTPDHFQAIFLKVQGTLKGKEWCEMDSWQDRTIIFQSGQLAGMVGFL